MHTKSKKSHGFTLIEMSIVIIIIGLVIGGIVGGQGLVENSRINATITQLSKYATAANTFKAKYNNLPGDFDKASILLDSSLSNGNGDNRILGGTSSYDANYSNGEPSEFWNHLSKAGMIEEQITQLDPTTNTTTATLGVNFPATKFNGGIAVRTLGNTNTWYVGTSNSYSYGNNTGLSPSAAHSIDSKLDDGMPAEGSIFLSAFIHQNKYSGNQYLPLPYPQTTTCTEVGNGDDYLNVGENYNPQGSNSSCVLTTKAGF